MKNIRIIFILLLLTTPVFAQDATPTDEIVIKSTDVVMAQVNANMKLTADQATSVRSIITDNVVRLRNLQLSLENGTIDGKTMYAKKMQLIQEEAQALAQVLTSDQMRVWINIQQDQ